MFDAADLAILGRPYFLGLHNQDAIDLRLLEMVRLVRPISKAQWDRGTVRTSLLSDYVLPRDYRGAARRRGQFLAPLLAERVVVLLGSDVSAAVGHAAEPFVWDGNWISIPHPIGTRHRFFNSYVNQFATGVLLSEILAAWEEHNGKG